MAATGTSACAELWAVGQVPRLMRVQELQVRGRIKCAVAGLNGCYETMNEFAALDMAGLQSAPADVSHSLNHLDLSSLQCGCHWEQKE